MKKNVVLVTILSLSFIFALNGHTQQYIKSGEMSSNIESVTAYKYSGDNYEM